jgi:hypothetical protein
MKRKRITIAAAAVLAVGFLLFYQFYVGNTAPPGQPPLVRLDQAKVSSLKNSFNGVQKSVRLLVMLSPT